MTRTFLPPAVLDRLLADGWTDAGVKDSGRCPMHRFERVGYHLVVEQGFDGKQAAIMSTAACYLDTRKRYPTRPEPAETYAGSVEAAKRLWNELYFLREHGIATHNFNIHRLTSGHSARSGKRSLKQDAICIVERARS